MPRVVQDIQVVDSQTDFSGCMNALDEPASNQFRYMLNGEIVDGKPQTRRGSKRTFPANVGAVTIGFYFNQDGAYYNDATHTGFWFPFPFVQSIEGGVAQDAEIIKKDSWPGSKFLVVTNGVPYVLEDGISSGVNVSEAIDPDEEIRITQAKNFVFIWRGPDKNVLAWDFTDQGFRLASDVIGEPGVADSEADPVLYWDAIPNLKGAIYFLGRLWGWNIDDMAATDLLDLNNWDLTLRRYPVNYGDGDEIVTLFGASGGYIIACKSKSMVAFGGVGDDSLESVSKTSITNEFGPVGPNAMCQDGDTTWVLSYIGIKRVFRNQFGGFSHDEENVDAKLGLLMDRISWTYVSGACAGANKEYVLFGVPVDGATRNNAFLVWSRKLSGWIGLWKSKLIEPVKLFNKNDELHCLCRDGVIRQLLTGDHTDSDNPSTDFPVYNEEDTYRIGDVRRFTSTDGVEALYKCIQDTPTWEEGSSAAFTHDPDDEDFWELVEDPWDEVQIEFSVTGKRFDFGDPTSDKQISIFEAEFSHQDPEVSVSMEMGDPYETESFFTDETYSQVVYDYADMEDWDPTNVNLDAREPGRQDYTLLLREEGIYMDSTGLELELWESHSLRFPVLSAVQRGGMVTVSNTHGKIRLEGITGLGRIERFAGRDR